MKSSSTLLVLAALLASGLPAVATPDVVQLETDDQKTFYALGLALSQRLANFELSPDEVALIEAGLTDGALRREPRVDLQVYGPKIDPLLVARATLATEQEKAAGLAFCAEAAKEPDALLTDSGVVYVELEPGTGETPVATDTVKLHYHGTLRNGDIFDSSIKAGEPVSFKLDAVIPCFAEGLTRMKVGGKSKLTCPPDMAYGDRGVPAENSVLFYLALRKAKVPAELHVYATGRHGLGLAPDVLGTSSWPRRCADWMKGLGLLDPS